ncbi:MAG: glycosyltransferase family 4 protein [Streptosporangiaceae bacterium]
MKHTVLMAHPSPDLYGSDRMMVESVRALVTSNRVVVALPSEGPLGPVLREAGAEVVLLGTPVLRKAHLSPVGLVSLALAALRALVPAVRLLRRERAAALYVNTVTLPLWLLAGAIARVPSLCHVHEAEEHPSRLVRAALAAPLRLARLVVVNSRASAAVLGGLRTQVIYNGVDGPAGALPLRAELTGPIRLVLVGRWSPRKGTDLAVRAAGLLADRGHEVLLTLVGDVFPGYEWFEQELRDQAGPQTVFAGFQESVWGAFADADIVLVPSRVEPFGNVAVEGMLAGRPVVAAATQGLVEIVRDGETGVLVRPGDACALADGVEVLVKDWTAARNLAKAGNSEARRRFGRARYRDQIQHAVHELITARTPTSR